MKPIKCLLLLAAVLSFAALNAAYVLMPGDKEKDCEQWNDKDRMCCLACCKLLYKKLENGRMYKMRDDAWNEESKCVCSYDVGEPIPFEEDIARYEEYINGEKSEASAKSRRVIPGVSITKID
jgi:hypothetical protein